MSNWHCLGGPVSEELGEKVTPLSPNASMRIAARLSEAEELRGIARVAGDHRKANGLRERSRSDTVRGRACPVTPTP
jgi:hypothetical protein